MKSSLLVVASLLATLSFAAPAAHQTYEPKGNASYAKEGTPSLLVGSTRERYDRDTLPSLQSAKEIRLHGWRGERVVAQVLVTSPTGIQELRIEPCSLGKAPVNVQVVRYTKADGKLVADILETPDRSAFEGVTRPLWLSFDIPAKAKGTLKGDFTVYVNGTKLTLPLVVEVVPRTLPPAKDWTFHLDFWQHPDAVARWHDVPMWSRAHLDLLKPQMQRLANMGQKTITATLIDEAWNAQVYDRFRAMVNVTKKKDGTFAYDFGPFDTWVTFMREEIGMKDATIHCYTMVPWTLTFPYFDEAQGKTVAPKLQPGSQGYEDFWGPFLTAFVKHLRAKGWEKQTRLALDERPDKLLLPALEVVKKYAPSLKIVAACDHPSNVNQAFDDVSYTFTISEQLVPVAESRRKEGKFTTFYVCLYPARPNTFLHSGIVESEWLPLMAANYGLDGMLRWAYQSFVEDPFVSTDYVKFPSGDCFLTYPGDRSSLRLELLREGIESFEKVRILTQRGADLKPALKAFSVSEGQKATGHKEALEALDQALRAAE